ncbi:c-type cytochrome [Roseicella aquatilis]|uniref:Cytochrome c4 n=1 Tax=Roseicella aquatilis TaxID=2527868 RepID=A0A4R4DEX0_9PROT|nr:c-type cytochrome [Roseicella aquatilis]TCZ58779.1 cytochrome c4 [Roseicella aquatilis]
MRHVLAALAATVSVSAWAADIEAGRQRAEACVTCHGTEGITADPAIPSLAGQKERYLQWQLVFFRNGRRQSEIMGPLAATLSDEELRNLGAYFASLPRANPPAGAPDPVLHERGRQAAARHRCASCHLDDYGGSQAAPAVAHQTRTYTEKALRDYRGNARPSVGVAAMNEVAAGLSDEEIVALALYLENPG